MKQLFAVTALFLIFVLSLHTTISQGADSPPQPASPTVAKAPDSSQPMPDKGHRREISIFVFSPDGRIALTGDDEENNFLWDLKSGAFISPIGKREQIPLPVVAAGFTTDSTNLLWARSHKHMPVFWDLGSRRRVGVLSSKEKGHSAELSALALSGDGRYVVTGDVQGNIVLWNLNDKSPVRKFRAHAGKIGNLLFVPGRDEFVSSGDDGSVKLWMVSRSIFANLKETGSGVTALTASFDGKIVYAASDDGAVREWNVATRRLRGTLRFDNKQINGIGISPDGDFMALAGEEENLVIWSLRGSKVVWKKKMDYPVLQVRYSPDGKSLFTSGGDNWIREWDVSTGRLIKRFGGVGG